MPLDTRDVAFNMSKLEYENWWMTSINLIWRKQKCTISETLFFDGENITAEKLVMKFNSEWKCNLVNWFRSTLIVQWASGGPKIETAKKVRAYKFFFPCNPSNLNQIFNDA